MSLSKNWLEREAKKIQRDKFFEGLNSCKSYLTLCGRQCVDIQEALRKGILTHQDRITAVERENEDYAEIHKWFRENWPGGVPGPIHSDLHRLSALTTLTSYDLVFLDYLGNLTFEGADWIRNHLAPCLLPGARLGMTISSSQRGSVFYPALEKHLRRWYPDLCSITGRELLRGNFPQDVLNYAVPYVILISCYLFPKHNFKWDLHYGGERESTHRMLLFRLMDMQPVQKSRLVDLEAKAETNLVKFINRGYKKEIKTSDEKEPVEKMQTLTGEQVISAIIQAQTPGKKAVATKMLHRYADQREREGKNRVMVIAGIKARIKRIENGNA